MVAIRNVFRPVFQAANKLADNKLNQLLSFSSHSKTIAFKLANHSASKPADQMFNASLHAKTVANSRVEINSSNK